MKHLRLLVLVAVLFVGVSVKPAAAIGNVTENAPFTGTCSSFSASGTAASAWVGVTIRNIDTGTFILDSGLNSGAPGAFFPVIYNEYSRVVTGTYSFTVTFPEQPAGTRLQALYSGFNDPTKGSFSNEFVVVTVISPCVAAPANVNLPGPNIPSGFVLHTMKCNAAVFNMPAGTPVGENAVKAGQTWYVNPVSIKGTDGKQWTEIFVGGYINGFIPTSCVG
jgi:hypothetical protein